MLLLTVGVCSVTNLLAGPARAETSDEVAAFVNDAVSKLAASSLQIPQFKAVAVDAVEDLGKADGGQRYLCWLKNSEGRVGYMAVVAQGGSYCVLAFSASVAPPDYFLKWLQMPQMAQPSGPSFQAVQESFVEGVPLVAVSEVTLAQRQPLDVSETACSLAGVLRHLQEQKKALLFGQVKFGGDPEYMRRYTQDVASAQIPEDANWISFDRECRQAVLREGISRATTAEEGPAFKLRQHEIIKPILRRRLLAPYNAGQRFQREREAPKHRQRVPWTDYAILLAAAVHFLLALAWAAFFLFGPLFVWGRRHSPLFFYWLCNPVVRDSRLTAKKQEANDQNRKPQS